jgi:7,8-dihydropterin-6-yl-methyl-4-(beta-D-ribofuranosyl)aminobenzene 5'-phosphate synthase
MTGMDRREFIVTAAMGGVALGLGGIVFQQPLEAMADGKFDIGQCRRLTVKCVSELGWLDGKYLIGQMEAAGGPQANQWEVPWDPKNAAGSCSLIDMETLDGRHHKFLLDTGWNNAYMDKCFKREGIDEMLRSGEIEFLVISHEHLDHYWGLETTLKYNPKIPIHIPATFYPEGMQFLKGAEFPVPSAKNAIAHEGVLVQSTPGKINKIFDGCALVAFDLPILIRVRGEQSLYFNVKDVGIVCVTGCCHQTILTFADFAREHIMGGENLYGLYGGLHIAPFGPLKEKQEETVKSMAKYQFKKIACNHCTGLPAVEKMIELGYPVVKGSGRHGSESDLYVGNGDEVVFG